nr:hypothetical protein BHI3_30410 [Bacteriovorax sp. HI3]
MKSIYIGLMLMVLNPLTVFAKGGDDTGNGGSGLLKRSPVQQYSCILKAGKYSPDNGGVEITSYARQFFYYLNEVMPEPIEDNPFYVCHDAQLYGERDSIEFPRLDLISNIFPVYSRFDSRFQSDSSGKMQIDRIIQDRVLKEIGVNYQSDLFFRYRFNGSSFGYVVRPFLDTYTNSYYCPSSNNFFISPVLKIITEYTGETEGLYLGEMEPQRLVTPNENRTIIAKLQVAEKNIMKYGFYIRDGLKKRIEYEDQIETETIYFYYPFSDVQDPLIKGSRKIVTVKFADPDSYTKKLGCVFNKN